MFPFFVIIIMTMIAITLLLLPCIISAAFFEWGVSRWKRVEFNKYRYKTILILCIAFRLLLPTMYYGKLGTEYKKIFDLFSGYRNCHGEFIITEIKSY